MKRTYRDYMGVGEKKSITNSRRTIKSGFGDEDKFEEFAGDLLMNIVNLVKEKMNQYGATKEDAVLALTRLEPEDPNGYMSYIENSKKAVKSAFDDDYDDDDYDDDGFTLWDEMDGGLYVDLFSEACNNLNVFPEPSIQADEGIDVFFNTETDEEVGAVDWSVECDFMNNLIAEHSKGEMSDEDFVAAVQNFVKQHLSKEGVKSSKKAGKPSKKAVKSSF